jgi:hypothetical protein
VLKNEINGDGFNRVSVKPKENEIVSVHKIVEDLDSRVSFFSQGQEQERQFSGIFRMYCYIQIAR